MTTTNDGGRRPPDPGHLPGLGLHDSARAIRPGVSECPRRGNGYEPEQIERTIAVWHHDARDRAARGLYVLGTNAERRVASQSESRGE